MKQSDKLLVAGAVGLLLYENSKTKKAEERRRRMMGRPGSSNIDKDAYPDAPEIDDDRLGDVDFDYVPPEKEDPKRYGTYWDSEKNEFVDYDHPYIPPTDDQVLNWYYKRSGMYWDADNKYWINKEDGEILITEVETEVWVIPLFIYFWL